MDFLSINNDDKLATLAMALVGREQELFHYKLNVDNYTLMLAVLPNGEWPESIAQYKGQDPSNLTSLDAETSALVADYAYRDRLRTLLVTENIEMNKSKRVYDVIKAQIPADQLDALVVAAKAKMA